MGLFTSRFNPTKVGLGECCDESLVCLFMCLLASHVFFYDNKQKVFIFSKVTGEGKIVAEPWERKTRETKPKGFRFFFFFSYHVE